MCGLSGYAGVKSADTRFMLALGLGMGIDARGGDASGYVSLSPSKTRIGKRPGKWTNAKDRFVMAASRGDILMMHARYATCGKDRNSVTEAHPFTIRRDGKVVLYGAHNGVLHGTHSSAAKYGRPHTVDSRELFELLADNKLDEIADIEGYGVITWVEPGTPGVFLCRISSHSDIHVVALKAKADGPKPLVWGSTKTIVKDAVDLADQKIAHDYDIEVGKVYRIDRENLWVTERPKISVADMWGSSYTYYGGKATRPIRSRSWVQWDDERPTYSYPSWVKTTLPSSGDVETLGDIKVADRSDDLDLEAQWEKEEQEYELEEMQRKAWQAAAHEVDLEDEEDSDSPLDKQLRVSLADDEDDAVAADYAAADDHYIDPTSPEWRDAMQRFSASND